MPKVRFVNENIEVNVNSCTNLRKLALKHGVPIYQGKDKFLNCHGLGLCGTCAVEVAEGDHVSPKKRGEDKILTKKGQNADNRRLSCQCLVYGDMDVVTFTK